MKEKSKEAALQVQDVVPKRKNISQAFMMLFVLVLAVLITLAVVANDIFSSAQRSAEKDVVESVHILRNERETYLKFRLNEFEGVTQIAFPENYLENFKINLIYPQPLHKQYINGNIIYTYNAEDAGMVTFYMEPRKTGRIKGSLLVGEESYTLTHLVYP